VSKSKRGTFTVHRSGIQVGMKTLSDGYHVHWKTRWEEESVASFWIGLLTAEESERRATTLAGELNARRGAQKP
jgi:hypothetical protein